MTEPVSKPGVMDIFRRILGWTHVANAVLPLHRRRKLRFEACVHIPGAEKAEIHT